jgi:hypothetical protein
MVKFFEEILNVFSENRGMAESICKNAGYSSGTNLLKAFKKPSGEFEKFNGLIYVVNEAFGTDSEEKFLTYAQQLNPNKVTSKSLLEYAALNRYGNVTDHLIEEFLKSNKKEIKEWGVVYDLDRKSALRELTGYDLINEVSPVQFKQLEVKVFAKLVQVYEYYDMKEFKLMKNIAQDIENEIRSIKDEFIKDSYLTRFCLIMTSVMFHEGDLESCRKYAQTGALHTRIGNMKSLFSLYVGNSYIYDNYNLAKTNFLRGLEQSKEGSYQRNEIKRSLNFLGNLWKKEIDLNLSSKEISDVHEVIYSYVNKGNTNYAIMLLNSMDKKDMTESQLGFHFYLRGLATGKEEHYIQSIDHFRESGNKFYLKLPLLKLEQSGYNQRVIRSLAM